MRYLIYIGLIVLGVSCAGDQKKSPEKDAGFDDEKIETVVADTAIKAKGALRADTTTGHTSQNSLDWQGTYKGVLPCADCEGLDTEIKLMANQTYEMTQHYLGKKGEPVKMSGDIEWTNGAIIELKGAGSPTLKMLVGEGQLYQLDLKGRLVKGKLSKKYILKKIS